MQKKEKKKKGMKFTFSYYIFTRLIYAKFISEFKLKFYKNQPTNQTYLLSDVFPKF